MSRPRSAVRSATQSSRPIRPIDSNTDAMRPKRGVHILLLQRKAGAFRHPENHKNATTRSGRGTTFHSVTWRRMGDKEVWMAAEHDRILTETIAPTSPRELITG